jgi:uncharacterized membrane protein YgdD (TMEM256/DUF423 family)
MQIQSSSLRWAAVLGAVTVAIGAFGAHGLKPHFSPYQVDIFEKGVQYQFYHVLALAVVGILASNRKNVWLTRAKWCFTVGILAFSGSLYLLAMRDLLPFSVAFAGPVTPLGGLLFIGGWLCLLKDQML